MADTEYRQKLYDVIEVPGADNLVIGATKTGNIYVTGTGDIKRGTLLMSSGNNEFMAASVSDLESAKELCILAENLDDLPDSTTVNSTGYFIGEFSKEALIISGVEEINDEIIAKLRVKGIYLH